LLPLHTTFPQGVMISPCGYGASIFVIASACMHIA
jgi:hypothetical protein